MQRVPLVNAGCLTRNESLKESAYVAAEKHAKMVGLSQCYMGGCFSNKPDLS